LNSYYSECESVGTEVDNPDFIQVGMGSFGELVFSAAGKLIVYFPMWVYDVCVFLFYPLNFLITAWASSSGPNWDDVVPDSKKPTLHSHEADVLELKSKILSKSKELIDERQLISLFDSLPGASPPSLVQHFDGHVIRTGSLLDLADKLLVAPLSKLGFSWGKRYRSSYVGDPLLVYWKQQLVFPLPIWGNVCLPFLCYRGTWNATMVYDHHPWYDHFRVLDERRNVNDGTYTRVLLGCWCSRTKIGGWFTLSENVAFQTPYHRLAPNVYLRDY